MLILFYFTCISIIWWIHIPWIKEAFRNTLFSSWFPKLFVQCEIVVKQGQINFHDRFKPFYRRKTSCLGKKTKSTIHYCLQYLQCFHELNINLSKSLQSSNMYFEQKSCCRFYLIMNTNNHTHVNKQLRLKTNSS